YRWSYRRFQALRKDVLNYATHCGFTPNDALLGFVRAAEQGRSLLSPRTFDGCRSGPLPRNVECALLFPSPSRGPLASARALATHATWRTSCASFHSVPTLARSGCEPERSLRDPFPGTGPRTRHGYRAHLFGSVAESTSPSPRYGLPHRPAGRHR